MVLAADRVRHGGGPRLSRRTLLGGVVGAFAAGASMSSGGRAASTATEPGTWRTWVLSSGDEVRPAAPPPPSAAEFEELRRLQAQRTAATAQSVTAWATGPAVLPWTGIALDLIKIHQPGPVRAARALALVHAAMQDAAVAVWDAKATYPRPAPVTVDQALVPLGSDAVGQSSFPSEHAAVAAAAALVLTDCFPAESTEGLTALADEAATSRLWAAANVRSDVEAGLAIGRVVGQRAVARAKADGSDAAWDGSGRPAGEEFWQPTPPAYVQHPLDPVAGTWRTWVLPRGDAYRPPPPPAWGTPGWRAELQAVQEAVAHRTAVQEQAVHFWDGGPGTVTPAGLWLEIARELIVRDGLDTPHAARVLALTSVALADGMVCCWDAKYAYWAARPVTADPSLDVLIATPPFPSYTSGHATASAAAAAALSHLFPADVTDLAAKADEAAQSRLWAGIHFPVDTEMGLVGGGLVGRLVAARAQSDEALGGS